MRIAVVNPCLGDHTLRAGRPCYTAVVESGGSIDVPVGCASPNSVMVAAGGGAAVGVVGVALHWIRRLWPNPSIYGIGFVDGWNSAKTTGEALRERLRRRSRE
jgi:hypothetical protein